MRGDRETTLCLDQLDYLTKHNDKSDTGNTRVLTIRFLSFSFPLAFDLH